MKRKKWARCANCGMATYVCANRGCNNAEDVRREADREKLIAHGFSWEYPGFYLMIYADTHITIGYDNGPKRFCVQVTDDQGTGLDWDGDGDYDTIPAVLRAVRSIKKQIIAG